MNSLGDRMKRYERASQHVLVRRTPVIVRVDGRAFHTFTRGCNRPFDSFIADAMHHATCHLVRDMQGCSFAYTQSDEASFLLVDFDRHETQAWFDNELPKIVSISASHFAVRFMEYMTTVAYKGFNPIKNGNRLPVFDSRAFNVPREDVANYFLWRAKDWERNSLQMFARSFFSHRELEGKNTEDMHEMLHGIGKNWTRDVSTRFKNGTWFLAGPDISSNTSILPNYEGIAAIVDPCLVVDE